MPSYGKAATDAVYQLRRRLYLSTVKLMKHITQHIQHSELTHKKINTDCRQIRAPFCGAAHAKL